MKKFELSPKDFRKFALDANEHEEFALALREAQKLLEPWVQRFYHAYPVNGKEVKELLKTLRLISSTICSTQDNHWYSSIGCEVDKRKNPYYGQGKIAWI